jgi:hypothetical protein
MLLARPLNGFGDADPGVKQLQLALTQLAQVTGRPNVNPQTTNGEMTDATMIAIVNALGILSEELPTYAYVGVQAGLIIGSTTSFAKKTVTQYAPVLAAATSAAAAKWAHDHPATPTLPITPTSEETPWYKTPLGIGGIVLGGIVVYKILFSPSQKAA